MLWVFLSIVLWASGTLGGTLCPSDLGNAITQVLENCTNCQRAYWGIQVDMLQSDGSSETLYELNPQHFFLPASNNKIITTSVAFHELGPEFTVETTAYVNMYGDLCIQGRGDPSLTYESLVELSNQLVNLGVMQIRNVFLDNTYWDGPILPQNWEWSDVISDYGAQPYPLMLDENAIYFEVQPGSYAGDNVSLNFTYDVDWMYLDYVYLVNMTEDEIESYVEVNIEPEQPYQIFLEGIMSVGSSPIPVAMAAINPAERFNLMLLNALTDAQVGMLGIGHNAGCNADDPDEGWKPLTSITSPTLSSMMNYTLLVSDNLYAETFLLHLGKLEGPANSTREAGIHKIWEVQTGVFGTTNGSWYQDDGSGLSRHNLVSPQCLVEILTYAYNDLPNGDLYLSYLPVAGETGTLQDRYVGTPAQGVLHAKTGTMDGVNCLSGFIDHEDSEHPILIFSIMANNAAAASIPAIDEIGVLLASVVNC